MTIALLTRPTIDPTIEAATRREFLAGLAAAGLLAGCGTTAAPAPTEPATRSLDHSFGTTDIPTQPQRIVAADEVTFGVLASLGVVPVGAAISNLSGTDYLAAFTGGVTDVSGESGPGLEKVAAADPDLIITLGFDSFRERFDALAPIAPTVAPDYNYVTLEQTTAHWRGVADAAGATATADQVIGDLQSRIESLRTGLGARMADRPVSVLRVGTEGFYSVRFGTLESSLLQAIGVPRPANQQDPEGFAFDLSLERVADIDAFAIFVYVDAGADDEQGALMANPLWNRLDAVTAERAFLVEAGIWNGLDPIAANLILDDVERHLGPLV